MTDKTSTVYKFIEEYEEKKNIQVCLDIIKNGTCEGLNIGCVGYCPFGNTLPKGYSECQTMSLLKAKEYLSKYTEEELFEWLI